MASNRGELEKVRIEAYLDEAFNDRADVEPFVAQVNPEKIAFKYEVETEDEQPGGTSAAQPRFGRIKPQELTFEFLFDATGAVPLPDGSSSISDEGISPRIDHLKQVVLEFSGDIHQPHNLIIAWGHFAFKGVLADLSLEYRLFKPNGVPLRAAATARFKGYVDDELRVAEEDAQSPDITHVRTVREGDTLDRLCAEIYGDPSHYIAVAEANDLVDMRRIVAGTRLRFPPVKRNSDG